MAAKIIDGRQVAASIRLECKARVADLRERTGVTPGLAVILVGNNPASAVYVGSKIKACAEAGIRSFRRQFPADIDAETLISTIEDLNADPNVHGILVQLPLPPHIDMRRVLKTIDAAKDVDGFHLYNVGGLVVGETIFPPCTPYGVVKLESAGAVG
jgi:methylenetetrahydrofolate dehydrogenase (NADP+) / methenyltetrahydrofolate cyclohydrolase